MTFSTNVPLTLDIKQDALLEELKQLANDLNHPSKLFQFFNKKNNQKTGIYLYGPVGTGKTMLMQAFFEILKITKSIVHYQSFMQDVHESMHKLQNEGQQNIIPKIAIHYSQKFQILGIDEFEIKDIADAMIIYRLFSELIRRNIFIFITSNTRPNDLYKDGLQRESFLPFITKINNEFHIKYLNNNYDYRFKYATNIEAGRIIYPLNSENNIKFDQITANIRRNNFCAQNIETLGRKISFQKIYKRILITDHVELFTRDISYIDYVNICQQCTIIVVQNVEVISQDDTNTVTRFINFIDNAYFYKILLFMSLQKHPAAIYQGSSRAAEFTRTISRLEEMNSESYLLKLKIN